MYFKSNFSYFLIYIFIMSQCIEIVALYIDRVAFVNPQSKCRIRCLNGGVCAYKIKAPREHICICMEGYFEGTYCEKNLKAPFSSKDQSTIPSTTASSSTTSKLHEYTVPREEEDWERSEEGESSEDNEWNSDGVVAEDVNKQENGINYSQQQHKSFDNDGITRYQQGDGKFDDDNSFEHNNENKQNEDILHGEEEEEEEENDVEDGNLPYFDQNEDSSSTEVYELHEDPKEGRFRNVPVMETTTIKDQYTTPIHIIPKDDIVKTTPGPVNYYLQANDNNINDDDDGWMMVKKRNYAIRITNVSSNSGYLIYGMSRSFIFTLFYIIFTKYF